MKEKIRILIIDNDSQFRQNLANFLYYHKIFEVIGNFSWDWNLDAVTRKYPPNVILAAVDENSAPKARDLFLKQRDTKAPHMIGLLSDQDPALISELILRGMSGFLNREDSKEKIGKVIKIVLDGGLALPPNLTRKVFDYLKNPVIEKMSKRLTAKEFEVLTEVRKGLSYKELADHFHIGECTIRSHCKSIYKKLEVRGRIEAINSVFFNPGILLAS